MYMCEFLRVFIYDYRHIVYVFLMPVLSYQVTYDANGFLERNRDNLHQDLVACLLGSNNDFIKDLFTASKSDTGTISE